MDETPRMTTMAPSEQAARAHPLYDLPLRAWRPVPRLRTTVTRVPRPAFPVIDAHNHLGRWLTPDGGWMVPDPAALVELMDAAGVRAVINLDGRWGAELEENLERYDRAYPGRFATFCHIDWDELARPGFGERIAARLAECAAMGAKGLKVWKDLGLERRDHRGELVLLDDERLSPVWSAAAEAGLPVWVHTADPVAFFEPVDERNELLELLLHYPQWSFADPRYPRFERLIESLEAVVAAHPETTFVGVHAGCYAEDLDWVGRMLDEYPNFHIDIAARLAELGRRPRATRELIIRHSGRVLFGTDHFPPAPESYALHYRFLETADEYFPHDPSGSQLGGRWMISAVDLPPDVLRRVYAENAARLVPALASAIS